MSQSSSPGVYIAAKEAPKFKSSRTAHLPLQHPQLMPQGQNFSLDLCLLPIANAEQVDQKPDDRLQQACKHGSG